MKIGSHFNEFGYRSNGIMQGKTWRPKISNVVIGKQIDLNGTYKSKPSQKWIQWMHALKHCTKCAFRICWNAIGIFKSIHFVIYNLYECIEWKDWRSEWKDFAGAIFKHRIMKIQMSVPCIKEEKRWGVWLFGDASRCYIIHIKFRKMVVLKRMLKTRR